MSTSQKDAGRSPRLGTKVGEAAENVKRMIVGEQPVSIPKNADATRGIDATKDAIEQTAEEAQLDEHGQQLVSDTTQVLDDAKELLEEKNRDDKLARLAEDVRKAAEEVRKRAPKVARAVKGEVKEEGKGLKREAKQEIDAAKPTLEPILDEVQDLIDTSKSLAWNLLSSNDFRTLLVDLIDLIQLGVRKELQPRAERLAEALKEDIRTSEGGEMPATKQFAREVKEEVTSKVEETRDAVVEKGREIKERAEPVIEKAKQTAAETGEALKEGDLPRAKEIVSEAARTNVPSWDPFGLQSYTEYHTPISEIDAAEEGERQRRMAEQEQPFPRNEYSAGTYGTFGLPSETHATHEWRAEHGKLPSYRQGELIPAEGYSAPKDEPSFEPAQPEAEVERQARKMERKAEKLKEQGEQQLEQLYDRFAGLLNRIADNREYQQLINSVFRLFDSLKTRYYRVKEKTEEELEKQRPAAEDAANKVWTDLKDIVESFTDGKSLDDFTEHFWEFCDAVWNDPEVADWFAAMQDFVGDIFENPTRLQDKPYQDEGRELVNRGVNLFRSDKFVDSWNWLLDDGRDLVYRIRRDPATQRLAEDTQKLVADFMLEGGRVSWPKMVHSAQQLRMMLMPVVSRLLVSMPVPAIIGSTKKYDYRIDNVVFEATEIVPEHVYLQMQELADINVRRLAVPQTFGFILFQIRNIRLRLRDIQFWFRRKVFPKIEDKGKANVLISGEDTSVNIRWRVQSREGEPVRFYVDSVQCYIEHLKIDVASKEHDFLLKMMTKLFTHGIKHDLERNVEENLYKFAMEINDKLNEVSQRAHDKREEIGEKIQEAIDTTKLRIEETAARAERVARSSTGEAEKQRALDSSRPLSERAEAAKEYVKEKGREWNESSDKKTSA